MNAQYDVKKNIEYQIILKDYSESLDGSIESVPTKLVVSLVIPIENKSIRSCSYYVDSLPYIKDKGGMLNRINEVKKECTTVNND